jgi:hypothetical protein
MKQFENLPLQQGSHARMQFGILLHVCSFFTQ